MAEEALKKLEEQLNCSVCLDIYTDPKLLHCFHVYCQKCLVPLVDRDQGGHLGITCPTCRQVTPVPDRGVAGLQSAFHINRLFEVQDSVKKIQSPTATAEKTVGDATTAPSSQPDVRHCFDHAKEELKLFCETCEELVCLQCVIKGGKHHDHDCVTLADAFAKYQEEIAASLEPMERQMTVLKDALTKLDASCEEISEQRTATAGTVHDEFRILRENFDVGENEIIGQLDKITQGKLKSLAVQRDKIETSFAQVSSCFHFMKETLKARNEQDVLEMKTNTVKKVKELTTPFKANTLKPNTKADIAFLSPMAGCHLKYGQVVTPSLPDPSQCFATGKGLEVATVRDNSTVIVQVINFAGKTCDEPIGSLECKLWSEIAGSNISCHVRRRGQSQYKISYQPIIKGRHHLHIKAEGQHIRGSPFSIPVLLPIENISTPIRIIDVAGVAVNESREMVYTDLSMHCVSVFGPSGKKLRSFGTHGSGQDKFDVPRGVAMDGEGNIYVVDGVNCRVLKYTTEGQFLADAKGDNLTWPASISFNTSNNKVYVSDAGTHRIEVLNSNLTFSSTFGKKGSGKGQFSNPRGIACSITGKVYVADSDNNRIQVFTAGGKFLRMFGRQGRGKGELHGPSFLCCSRH